MRTGRFLHYSVNKEDHASDVVLSIVGYQEQLAIASYDGVYLFHPETATFTLLTNELAHYLKIDSKGSLWIAVEGKGVYCYNMDTKESTLYSFDLNKKNSISDNMVTCIAEDRNQRIWLSTMGGGLNLYRPETNDFERFTSRQDGLGSDCVYAVCESQNGRLLLTTNQGFCIFDPVNRTFSNYNHANGFPFTTLNEGSLCQTKDGEIFLGGMNGMVSFYEKQLNIIYKHYRIIPDRLLVNGNEVHVGDNSGILPVSLYDASSIVLKSNHSIFSFEFATSNYLPANKDESVYRLDGFSKDWTSTRGQNTITYTNLPAGDYTLLIKSIGKNKAFQADYRLDIRMLPPLYKTTWAYLIYIAIVGGLLYYVIRTYQTRFHLRESLKYEQQHIRDVEEMNQSKLRFFTNISHEFRTPLTLIQGALNKLINIENPPKEMQRPLKTMDKSTQRMLRLINQLLEFRKMQKNKLALSLEETDVIAFLYEIFLSFKDTSESKNIDFSFEPSQPAYKMFIDKGNLDKVTYNLLSNAFKYTPSNGKIIFKIDIQEDKQQLRIQVIDNGIGIPKEKRSELFKRFMQSSFSHSSVGVGLHLTHELVQVHKGNISYDENEGGGSVFTVLLPTNSDIYQEKDFLIPNQLLTEEEEQHSKDFLRNETSEDTFQPPVDPLNKRKVLIIEDDTDIREFLREEIGVYFEVEVAADGTSGFEKASTYDADLIVCDVLMPGMNGFEVTRKLKNEFTTSHIPIILLTALNIEEKYQEGIESGADAYITKPFNVSLLLARIFKLIELRDKLRQKYSNEPGLAHSIICTNDKDQKFSVKLNEVLNEHMTDTDFSVNDFAGIMGLGRTVFYKKVRGVTGYSPYEYLRVMRMKKAAEMLLTEDLTIAEVAYSVGINDPFYFSKCFKNQFGVSPSAYRKKLSEDENEPINDADV